MPTAAASLRPTPLANGLVYVNPDMPGLRRFRQGEHFRFKDAKGQWIALMSEWRQVLKDNKEKISEQIVADFVRITNEAMKKIRNDDDRKNAALFMKEQFAAKGY